jgi:16S rRNA (uracil1498-N3)-methyltransferase
LPADFHPTLPHSVRLYYPQLAQCKPCPRECNLDREQSRHGRTVLRLSVGDAVELIDGQGAVGLGRVVRYERGSGAMVCRIEQIEQVQPPRPRIVVAAALPKGPHADAMVDQLSQVGADELIALRSAYSVVDPRDAKIAKFQRRAIESAKQCRRAWVMQVTEPMDFAAILDRPGVAGLILQPGPMAAITTSPPWLSVQELLLLLGPEGGWSDTELADAQAAGFTPWSVSPHILRIETAAVAAVALLRYMKA